MFEYSTSVAAMHHYHVIDSWMGEPQVLLQDAMDRFHVARALNAPPPFDATLSGARPRLGFGILQCNKSGVVYRVVFEEINQIGRPTRQAWDH